jgi:hypothetical protein
LSGNLGLFVEATQRDNGLGMPNAVSAAYAKFFIFLLDLWNCGC